MERRALGEVRRRASSACERALESVLDGPRGKEWIARLGREIEAMCREREELVAAVGEAVQRWAPADLPSLDEVAEEGS